MLGWVTGRSRWVFCSDLQSQGNASRGEEPQHQISRQFEDCWSTEPGRGGVDERWLTCIWRTATAKPNAAALRRCTTRPTRQTRSRLVSSEVRKEVRCGGHWVARCGLRRWRREGVLRVVAARGIYSPTAAHEIEGPVARYGDPCHGGSLRGFWAWRRAGMREICRAGERARRRKEERLARP